MARKKTSDGGKAAAKAAKKAKAAQKVERKEAKKVGKSKKDAADEEDLEAILENVSVFLIAINYNCADTLLQ